MQFVINQEVADNSAPAWIDLLTSIVSLVVSPADFPLLCSALLQCDWRPMCSPHTGLQCADHKRIRGGCPHLHHVTIHLLQWESCGVLVLLPEHQQHHWREGEYKYCSAVGRYGS